MINVVRRQGCPHLGQGHGPIVSSRQFTRTFRAIGIYSSSAVSGERFIGDWGDSFIEIY